MISALRCPLDGGAGGGSTQGSEWRGAPEPRQSRSAGREVADGPCRLRRWEELPRNAVQWSALDIHPIRHVHLPRTRITPGFHVLPPRAITVARRTVAASAEQWLDS